MKLFTFFLSMIIFLFTTNVYSHGKEHTHVVAVPPPGLQKQGKVPPGLAKKGKVPPGWYKGNKNHGNSNDNLELPTVGNLVDKAFTHK